MLFRSAYDCGLRNTSLTVGVVRRHIGCESSAARICSLAGPKRSPIFGVPSHLCTHPLTQNYQIWHGNTSREGVSHASHPKRAEFQRSPILGFSCIYAYILSRRATKFGMVTHGEVRVLGGQPRHCVCTNASRGLSAIVEFLVLYLKYKCNIYVRICMSV